MSLSGAHKAAFRREVLVEGRVFAIRDGEGYPAPADPEGRRAVPFWSKPTRARRVADQAAAFMGFEIVVIELDDWLAGWLPCLERDDMLVGVNWSGARATGFDLTPAQVGEWFAEQREALAAGMQMAAG
ncbi:DUF2750 domain-containing protein [Actinoplanes sp. NPDC051411]|jgi:hypothetical protein|uniref:DUF2750 domain-containing protein n=1 Tax=Actinoplanes sp. NPDC051411 TaxID=3155522 RepID=UPI0034208E79